MICVQLMSENAKLPTRGTNQSAGLDLYTPIDITIPPHGDVMVPLDIRIQLEPNTMMLIRERSSVATKKKVIIGACVIDSDYRGNVIIHLMNISDKEVNFVKGEKIAQGIVFPVIMDIPIQVDEIDIDTSRGEGGFGSTGK